VPTGLLLGAVTVAVLVTLYVLVRVRAALDGVELTLRIIVTGLRTASRAARCVPGTTDAIAGDVVRGQGTLARLDALKERREQPYSQ
jgi:hypothetical protein